MSVTLRQQHRFLDRAGNLKMPESLKNANSATISIGHANIDRDLPSRDRRLQLAHRIPYYL
jgi:hypothetical protein